MVKFRYLGFLAPLAALLVATAPPAFAADPKPGPPITIRKASGPIVTDGVIDDAGWQGIEPVTVWFETRVGDNVEPQVKNVAYLAYDEQYLYAAFQFGDPAPKSIRAPLGDHDNLSGATDYGGLIIDSRNDGKTAQMFLANARGLKYDAISSDVSGEDNSPDWFWDAEGKITTEGWNLEIRVPFSSLRYSKDGTPEWGMLLYRNYPRERHYQFFSARLPRDVSCFICNSSKMTGLADLPHGSHLVVAPFATGQQVRSPSAGLGSPLQTVRTDGGHRIDSETGVDVKWSPAASLALDGTINPDFSQVESDVAQIAANERFALFFPEKRPFFLEGVDLLSTPMRAIYTRAVTSPRDGLRATGRSGAVSYTALYTHDRGGGSVIIPGPQGSGFADQDFESDVGVLRLRRDFGQSFVSVIGTGRELDDEGGGSGRYNRVFGPDFQWRPNTTENIQGQVLWSESNTPIRPDLAAEWNGQRLRGHAAQVSWAHNTRKVDWYLQGQDFTNDFRADNGFIPQVGYREGYLEAGYTLRPQKGLFSRMRFFTANWVDVDREDRVINRRVSIGSGMDGRWSSFLRVELNRDEIRVGNELLERFRPRVQLQAAPGRVINFFSLDTQFGDEIDFAHGREGSGTNLSASLVVRPSAHLELNANAGRRWVNVDGPTGDRERLFLAEVERLRATWMFNAKSFIRLIGQYEETTRDVSLYGFATAPKEAVFSGSGLFAYKLNWQTVLYLGYGDFREYLDTSDRLERAGQQAFAKISYAWQL